MCTSADFLHFFLPGTEEHSKALKSTRKTHRNTLFVGASNGT